TAAELRLASPAHPRPGRYHRRTRPGAVRNPLGATGGSCPQRDVQHPPRALVPRDVGASLTWLSSFRGTITSTHARLDRRGRAEDGEPRPPWADRGGSRRGRGALRRGRGLDGRGAPL